jgi:FkbH-like protein/FkbM family methyltransferase
MSTSVFCPAILPNDAATPGGPRTFHVGRGSMPFLADHGFQGLTVVPGALYLALALRAEGDASSPGVVTITGAEFHQPVILAEKEIALTVECTPADSLRTRCIFRESGDGGASDSPCTTLKIERGARGAAVPPISPTPPEIFTERAEPEIDSTAFYRRLRENGNQYGPRFQGLSHLRRSGNAAFARLSLTQSDEAQGFSLPPVAVDAAIQTLMLFDLEGGRTRVLRSIDTVVFRPPAATTGGLVWARLRPADEPAPNELTGDIEVRNEAGTCWLELRGVRLTAHDFNHAAPSAPAATTHFVVAATFTAEPIADVFRFWSDTLGYPTRLTFAPYAQVFQPLLDPDSLFRRNQGGCNVLLLNLADWAAEPTKSSLQLNPARAAEVFRDLDHLTLPNGLEVAQLNRHETYYVYREIFQDRCYLRHGIRLPETGTVIDIGANIGLFSLFVRSESPTVSVLAYEPSPAAFTALKANCEAYGPTLRPFNAGVSDRRGHASLTCYEKSSVFSTFHANAAEDHAAIRAVATNVAREQLRENAESVDGLVDELLTDRLNARTIECPIVSVSDIIRDHALSGVALLKIDAEKCELEILRGIEESHWPLIEQIVVEVHDRTRALLTEVQSVLGQHGFQCAVVEENLLTGSGLFNVYATRERAGAWHPKFETDDEKITRNVQRVADELVDALAAFTRDTTAQTLLAVVPSDEKATGSFAPLLAPIENELLRRVRELPGVHAVGSEEIRARYPSPDFHQPDARQLGHVSYTADGFAAIGTSVFRMFAALRRLPFKVIALDCDHTLWQGACGEDGPLGVAVTPAHRALQEFMLRQMEAGMLLCLCSKNHGADVWAVFEQNPAMVLKREHVAAARINWSAKSDNLRMLATELRVGLDSVIFLDDNPTECAEVRAHCPEVLSLQLPVELERIESFLQHVWAFDHFAITNEDRARTQMVAAGGRREKFREHAPTLESFIAGLELKVTVFPPDKDALERIAQLTQRTNQFNFSTIRRSTGDLRQFLASPAARCLAVRVTDRFGDYGLVGALLYATDVDGLRVDTFLLSCRVLGRGVEHQVLADLGRRAMSDGKSWIEFAFRPTEKNQPARDFIISLGAVGDIGQNTTLHRVTAAQLAGLRYSPSPPGDAAARAKGTETAGPPPLHPTAMHRPAVEKLTTVTDQLDDARKIAVAAEAHRLRAAGFSATTGDRELPVTLSGKLLAIWRRILGRPLLGLDDKFMEVGGTSLMAVQVVAAVRKELQFPLSVVAFFESPSVRLLAEKLSPTDKKSPTAAVDAAMARGARRNLRLAKKDRRPSNADAPRTGLGG